MKRASGQIRSNTLKRALACHRAGRLNEAERLYGEILASNPRHADSLHLLGMIAHQTGRNDLAVEKVTHAIVIRGDIASYHSNLGVILQALGRLDEAVASYGRAVALNPDLAEAHVNLGVIHQRQGRLTEAMVRYRRALQLRPDLAEAHLNLGSILQALGELDESLESYAQALALRPTYVDALYNRGNVLQIQGKLEDAVASYRQALALKPDHVAAYGNMGNALLEHGQWSEAAEAYQQAIKLEPNCAEAHSNLGSVLLAQGGFSEAVACYQRALALKPDFVDAQYRLGNAFQTHGWFSESVACYQRTLLLKPEFAEAHYNLGIALHGLGQLEAAAASFERAISLKPDYVEAHNNLGIALHAMKKFEAAAVSFGRAISLRPERVKAHYNLGIALHALDRLEGAAASFERAVFLMPEYAEAHYNLGYTLGALGKAEEALPFYRKALALKPDYSQARMCVAEAALSSGDYATGWSQYECRWQVEENKIQLQTHRQPLWSGESLGEGRLLVWGEQGVGDQVMFAGLIPDLLQELTRTGNHCTLDCDPRLKPLFSRSFPHLEILSGDAPGPDIEAHLPAGSLPRLFRTSESAFQATVSPYLMADPSEQRSFRTRYAEGKPLIGLAWYSNNAKTGRYRSVTLKTLAPLFAASDLRWVSLQYGDHAALKAQAEEAQAPLLIDTEVNQFTDIDRFAAQIAAMDLVITIDNSTAHLAGALGVPVWVMLPVAPDWRWRRERRDCPWYPSMRLFRQPRFGDWGTVVDEIGRALASTRSNLARGAIGTAERAIPHGSSGESRSGIRAGSIAPAEWERRQQDRLGAAKEGRGNRE